MIQIKLKRPFITGYYGCKCHPFNSWGECYKFQIQKLKIGQRVKHRCTGKLGVVDKLGEKGFVIIKFGDLQRDLKLEHVANLIKITY